MIESNFINNFNCKGILSILKYLDSLLKFKSIKLIIPKCYRNCKPKKVDSVIVEFSVFKSLIIECTK